MLRVSWLRRCRRSLTCCFSFSYSAISFSRLAGSLAAPLPLAGAAVALFSAMYSRCRGTMSQCVDEGWRGALKWTWTWNVSRDRLGTWCSNLRRYL